MLSTTISLYIGVEDALRLRYPRNLMITTSDYTNEKDDMVSERIAEVLEKQGVNAINKLYYRYVGVSAILEETNIVAADNVDTTYEDSISSFYAFDLEVKDEIAIKIYEDLAGDKDKLPSSTYLRSAADAKESFLAMYGGLFFIGIFLGALFIMATILIMYYKQISEGYEDKERFQIMQKVGLSKEEVKKTIHSQILTVFFLPLIVAIIHIAFAFPVITKLLAILNLTNVTLFGIYTGITILIFAIFYGIVYGITAKEYYKIVM